MTVYYSKEHEWVRVDGDRATIGITDYAQGALGDIVFVELPAVGNQLRKDTEAAVVESVRRPPTSTRRSAARWSKPTRSCSTIPPSRTAIPKALAGFSRC